MEEAKSPYCRKLSLVIEGSLFMGPQGTGRFVTSMYKTPPNFFSDFTDFKEKWHLIHRKIQYTLIGLPCDNMLVV